MKKHTDLPEPKAVKEVHAWRRKLQKRAEKVGWKAYLKALNEQPPILTPKPDRVVREKPSCKYGSQD